jgi:MOSC domain-containing protein YiiM
MSRSQEDYGPSGDSATHRSLDVLEARLAELPAPPREHGSLSLIVARHADGTRHTHDQIELTPAAGVSGDRWGRLLADKPEMQLTAIRRDVAEVIGNGQPLTVFGDNLFVDLAIAADDLPIGSRLRLGEALVEVSPMPHDGCAKFKQRFGTDALRLVSGKARRHENLRGIYWTTIEPGLVAVGDAISVISRSGQTGAT